MKKLAPSASRISKEQRQILLLLFLVFLFQFVLNCLTPLAADDYSYLYSYETGQRIQSISDIFISMRAHYLLHGGRIVAHFFAQLFLLLGKPFFNIINALVYSLFSFFIYRHTLSRGPEHPWLLLLINLILWFLLPVPGHTVFFLTGSCNYLFPMAVVLAFLLPFRLCPSQPARSCSAAKALAMLLFGFLAGFQSEIASGAAMLYLLLFSGIRIFKIEKLPFWWITGVLGCAAGLLVMVAAPGNFTRLADTATTYSGGVTGHLLSLFLIYTGKFLLRSLILLAAFPVILLLGELHSIPKDTLLVSGVLLVVSLVSSYTMLLSMTYPPRAQFTYVTFLILAFLYFYTHLDYSLERKHAAYSLISLALIGFLSHACFTMNDIGAVYVAWQARDQLIKEQKALGNTDIVVPAIDSRTPYSAMSVTDITSDPDHWMNRSLEIYYDVPIVRTP